MSLDLLYVRFQDIEIFQSEKKYYKEVRNNVLQNQQHILHFLAIVQLCNPSR
jgi:hypothetical protein